MKVLVTGAAGFIGFHLIERLLAEGYEVVGLDNINAYYDVNLKFARLAQHGIRAGDIVNNDFCLSEKFGGYRFYKADISDHDRIVDFMVKEKFDFVVSLAAQAGVRYSLENPREYTRSNIEGFLSVLEGSRHSGVKHLVYASSSSVYGMNESMPFSIHDNVDHPLSLYAASKKANELMAHTYSHLYNLPTTGLRFFTVYGPWGRPDMALFLFTKAILESKPIQVFNHGNMLRDFTFIDDIVEGLFRTMNKVAGPNPDWSPKAPDPGTSKAPYRLYNIGNNNPVRLLDFIEAIEEALGMEAQKELLPLQAGDVPQTYANVDDLINDTGFQPATPIKKGVEAFVAWYRSYYQI